jgi:hypothetical protein
VAAHPGGIFYQPGAANHDPGDALSVNVMAAYEQIPAELRQPALWLQYYLSPDPKKPDKKPRKHPEVKYATPEDRQANLKSLEYLIQNRRLAKNGGYQRYIDPQEGFVYIDLDHVRDSQTGNLQPWALELVERLDTYTEISASGNGLHLVARGTLPRDFKIDTNPVEIYSGHIPNKLLALTGDVLDLQFTINGRQSGLEEILSRAEGGEFGLGKSAEAPLVKCPRENDADMPASCLDGWLGEICRTRMADFPRAYAWPALLVAASVLVPRETKSRTNLFVDLDGPIHSGKSSAFEKAFHLMSLTKPALMQLKTGSAEGLAEYTGETGGAARLLYPDELAHLLEKSMIERSSLPRFLTTAFYQDEQILTVAKRKVVTFNARLSVAGGTVDNEFGDLFGHATTGGLHDRFLFGKCPTGYQYLWQDFSEEAAAFVPAGDSDAMFSTSGHQPVPAALQGDVWQERNRWIKEIGIQPRVAEICLRCAVICASFDGRQTLTAEMLGPALELAKYQTRVRIILQPNPGENPDARCAFAIRNWLTRNAPNGQRVGRRDLYLGTHAARLGPGVFDRALLHMEFNGEIESSKVGRTKTLRLTDEVIPGEMVTTGISSDAVSDTSARAR